MIPEKLLSSALNYLIPAGMGAAASIITIQVSLGYVEKRQDTDMAQIREIFRNRDEVDRVTREATKDSISRLQGAVDRLNQRMDNKFGLVDRKGYMFAQLVQVPQLPEPPPVPRIFDDKLKEMRVRLDSLIGELKAGKLDSEDKRDELYSLELDYEMLKGWQIWCETSPERQTRCLQHFKRKE